MEKLIIMKLALFSIFYLVMANTSEVISQSRIFNKNDNICYCTGTSTPQNIIRKDNNWEILLNFRSPNNLAFLDSIGVPYTHSQFELLENWGLMELDESKNHKTSIIILDSAGTTLLREYSKKISHLIVSDTREDILSVKSLLQKDGNENNSYTIVFSYIIDGLVWKYLEKDSIITQRNSNENNPYWSGEYWSMYPKRMFFCGTNSISEAGYSVKINWSEKIIPYMIPFVTRFDLQESILLDFISKGKLSQGEAFDVFKKFEFFDNDGEFTCPVFSETDQDEMYLLASSMAEKVVKSLMNHVDTAFLMEKFKFHNKSQLIVILYHEIIWDIMDKLVGENILSLPLAFESNHKVNPKDIAELLFFVKPK